jgi:2-oxoglutarate ferredoxin oxidoreductase subunit alpha
MERLRRKFETAKKLVPAPVCSRRPADPLRRDLLRFDQPGHGRGLRAARSQGVHVDALRVRGFPFADEVIEFIADHDEVFVVEQNRERPAAHAAADRRRDRSEALIRVLHYDGTPITARFIAGRIADALSEHKVTPIRKQVAS